MKLGYEGNFTAPYDYCMLLLLSMEDAMVCKVKSGDFELTCSCDDCAIWSVFDFVAIGRCCGQVFDMKVRDSGGGGGDRGREIFDVDLSNITVLQAAEMIEHGLPGRISLNASMHDLGRRIKLKGKFTFEELCEKLGLYPSSSDREAGAS